MPTTIYLDGNANAHELTTNYQLIAPGIVGEASLVVTDGSTSRGADAVEVVHGMDQALARDPSSGIEQTIRIVITRDSGIPSHGWTRSASDDALVLKTPDFGKNTAQAVLYTDEESGISQWIFPELPRSGVTTRGVRQVTYYLPRDPEVESETTGGNRGMGIKIIRKVVRLLVWRTDELLKHGIQAFISDWESRQRDYGWQMLPLTNRDDLDWGYLRGGRCLLLLHGTFSTAEAAFAACPPPMVSQLQAQYAGRVIAFNHPTMSTAPAANVDRLLQALPPDVKLDIITHSRGGLVGRELLQRVIQGVPIQVGKLIMVAAPNQGTPLADGDHWITMLDRYTSLVADLPDTTATAIMEGVLTVVKLIGHAGLKALDGLAAMTPANTYLHSLNSSPHPETTLYALASDYQPTDPRCLSRWGKQLGDSLLDTFFGAPNDGVVPTSGSYILNPMTGWEIPSDRRHVFATHQRIHHSSFFGHAAVGEQLIRWLKEHP